MKIFIVREDATEIDFEDILIDVYTSLSDAMDAAAVLAQCWKDGWGDEMKFGPVKWEKFMEVAQGGITFTLTDAKYAKELVTYKVYEMEVR